MKRADAIAAGLKRYNTGKPCKNGHMSDRHVNGSCLACDRDRLKREYQDPVEHARRSEAYRNWKAKNVSYVSEYLSEWVKKNRHKVNAYFSAHRKGVVNRTPAWANLEAIERIYKDCPNGMHVDHIVPLNGKMVCGLHVDNNLQYLTPLANMQKLNKFETDWT